VRWDICSGSIRMKNGQTLRSARNEEIYHPENSAQLSAGSMKVKLI
jgi:hypothetical protein